MAEEGKNKPNYKCDAYQRMEEAWKIVCDLAGGTLHLRKNGTAYLPVEPAEDLRNFSFCVKLTSE